MKLIAMDCTGSACSAAVLANGKVLAVQRETMDRGQAERLPTMLSDVLAKSGMAPTDLDAVAATVGPGGFTSVRIGISAALGLARSSGAQAVGVSATEALAATVPAEVGGRLLAAVDSRRAEPFCERFDADESGWRGAGPYVAANRDILRQSLGRLDETLLIVGDAAATAQALLEGGTVCSDVVYPDPVHIARLANATILAGRARPPAPLYLRAPDVSPPSRDRARRPPRL